METITMFMKSFAVLAALFISGSALAQQGFYVSVGFGSAEVTSKDILIEMPQGGTTLASFKEDDGIDKLMSEHDKPPNVDSVMRPLRNSKTQRRVVPQGQASRSE